MDEYELEQRRLGKHLDSIQAAPAPIPDDAVSRLQVIEAIDRLISDRRSIVNPASAWWVTDTAILGVLDSLREIVIELEGQ